MRKDYETIPMAGSGWSWHLSLCGTKENVMRHCLVVACLMGAATTLVGADPQPVANNVGRDVGRLASPYAEVRLRAASDLGNLGRAGRDAVPALARALQDRDAYVRRHAGK